MGGGDNLVCMACFGMVRPGYLANLIRGSLFLLAGPGMLDILDIWLVVMVGGQHGLLEDFM